MRLKSKIYFHFFASAKEKKIKLSHEDYIKNFNKNSTLDDRFQDVDGTDIIYSVDDVNLLKREVSTYLEEPMAIALSYVPDENYILCPLYKPSKKNINDITDNYEWSDFQLGFTGTLKSNEIVRGFPDYYEGYKRELSEELGLVIKNDDVVSEFDLIEYTDDYGKTKNIKIYNINLSQLELNKKVKKPSSFKDVKKEKIGGFVHSNELNVLKYLNSDIILSSNEDNLVGVIAVKAIFAKKYYGEKFNVKYQKNPQVKKSVAKKSTRIPSWMTKENRRFSTKKKN